MPLHTSSTGVSLVYTAIAVAYSLLIQMIKTFRFWEGKMLGGWGHHFILCIAIEFGSAALSLGAVKVLRPTQHHFETKLRAEDCFIHRRVYHKSRLREAEIRLRKRAALAGLQKFRSELEKCGDISGGASGVIDEQLLAEVCPAAYQRWLDTEIQMEVAEEDETLNFEDKQDVKDFIGENCRRLPPVVSNEGIEIHKLENPNKPQQTP